MFWMIRKDVLDTDIHVFILVLDYHSLALCDVHHLDTGALLLHSG